MTPGTILLAIRLPYEHTVQEWTDAVTRAYERLELDPRCDIESIRQPELIGSDQGGSYYHVTADTKGGDVLKVLITVSL